MAHSCAYTAHRKRMKPVQAQLRAPAGFMLTTVAVGTQYPGNRPPPHLEDLIQDDREQAI